MFAKLRQVSGQAAGMMPLGPNKGIGLDQVDRRHGDSVRMAMLKNMRLLEAML